MYELDDRYPDPRRKSRTRVLITLGLLAIAVLAGYLYTEARAFPRQDQQTRAIFAAQALVRMQFSNGYRLDFNPPEWSHVEKLAEGKYVISGWFSAVTNEGSQNGYTFRCLVSSTGDGDWAGEKIEVTSQ